jgi:putative copper export protein/methionine-rich copper-binding protein CopC
VPCVYLSRTVAMHRVGMNRCALHRICGDDVAVHCVRDSGSIAIDCIGRCDPLRSRFGCRASRWFSRGSRPWFSGRPCGWAWSWPRGRFRSRPSWRRRCGLRSRRRRMCVLRSSGGAAAEKKCECYEDAFHAGKSRPGARCTDRAASGSSVEIRSHCAWRREIAVHTLRISSDMTGLRRTVLLAFTASSVIVPSSARAHGLLRESSPRAGARLIAVPSEIRLTFTERPERLFTRITLTGPDRLRVALDSVVITGFDAVARINGSLIAGTYTVEWQTAGDDGHPVRGDYTFSVAPGATGTVVPAVEGQDDSIVTAPVASSPAFPEELALLTPFSVVLRWLTLLGIIAAIGVVAFRTTVLARVEKEMDPEIAGHYLPAAIRAAATLGIVAVAMVAVVAVARLLTQSAAMNGTERMLHSDLVGRMLTETVWGRAWLVQLGMAAVAVVGFAMIRRSEHAGWIVAGVGSVGLALSLALSGHAVVVAQFAAATVVAHVVHTVAASGWLGSLLAIVLVGLPLAFRLDRDDRWTVVADIVHTFSPAALVFASIAALAGVFMAWTHLPAVNALWTSEYGRILMLKLGLITGTALTGAYNWLHVRPSLGDPTGARRLRRSATVELAIAALVVAVTAVLVATPTPMS